MSVFRYPTYKIRIAPDSQKTQGLQAGDIIRRQYAERERTVYSLMCVTETGTELVGDKDALISSGHCWTGTNRRAVNCWTSCGLPTVRYGT